MTKITKHKKDKGVLGWMTVDLIKEVGKVFEPRYDKKILRSDLLKMAFNYADSLEILLQKPKEGDKA